MIRIREQIEAIGTGRPLWFCFRSTVFCPASVRAEIGLTRRPQRPRGRSHLVLPIISCVDLSTQRFLSSWVCHFPVQQIVTFAFLLSRVYVYVGRGRCHCPKLSFIHRQLSMVFPLSSRRECESLSLLVKARWYIVKCGFQESQLTRLHHSIHPSRTGFEFFSDSKMKWGPSDGWVGYGPCRRDRAEHDRENQCTSLALSNPVP